MSTPKSERILREEPPRSINLFTQVTTLTGGLFTQMGWLFFGFGMIFVLVFGMRPTKIAKIVMAGKWEQTTGVVTYGEGTNGSVNEVTVYRFHYEFTQQGRSYNGQCYITGNRFRDGEEVTVLYKPRKPEISKIEGSRLSQFPLVAGIVTSIFPLIGLIFIIIGTNQNRKALQLLQQGIFTRGTRISKSPTNTTVNEQPVWKYEFAFEDSAGKQHTATCKTHITHLVEDEEQEIILYHPAYPEYNIVFDAIPSGPSIDPEGRLTSAPAIKALTLIVPGLVILGYALYFLLRS
ncbi:MAG: DUF3592 domain-containing protein [Bacteroidota bacterium]